MQEAGFGLRKELLEKGEYQVVQNMILNDITRDLAQLIGMLFSAVSSGQCGNVEKFFPEEVRRLFYFWHMKIPFTQEATKLFQALLPSIFIYCSKARLKELLQEIYFAEDSMTLETAKVLYRSDKYEEAVYLYERVARRMDSYGEDFVPYGFCLYRMGRLAEARRILQGILYKHKEGGNPLAVNCLRWIDGREINEDFRLCNRQGRG